MRDVCERADEGSQVSQFVGEGRHTFIVHDAIQLHHWPLHGKPARTLTMSMTVPFANMRPIVFKTPSWNGSMCSLSQHRGL